MTGEIMLNDKVIIIIGATGGLGSAFARRFYEEGARLVLGARTRDKLAALALEFDPERALVVPTDASQIDDVTEIFHQAAKTFGQVDAVVISAGTWRRLSVDDPVEEAVDLAEKHFESLILPTFVTAFIAQKFFRKNGHGLIANISSHAAVRPHLPGNLTYSPSKAYARQFMLALRHELGGTGVRVTDIEPAIVDTPDNTKLLDTEDKRRRAVRPEAIADWIIEHFDDPDLPAEVLFDSEIVV